MPIAAQMIGGGPGRGKFAPEQVLLPRHMLVLVCSVRLEDLDILEDHDHFVIFVPIRLPVGPLSLVHHLIFLLFLLFIMLEVVIFAKGRLLGMLRVHWRDLVDSLVDLVQWRNLATLEDALDDDGL